MREVRVWSEAAGLDQGADETIAVVHLSNAAVYAAHLALIKITFAVDIMRDAFLETGSQYVVKGHVHGVELDFCHVQLVLADLLGSIRVDE